MLLCCIFIIHYNNLAVDGGWSEWVTIGSCSKSCGSGEQNMERTCTNPSPQHNGKQCEGRSSKTESCNEHPCPGINS